MIAQPIDFTTIRARLDAGGYGSWDVLAADMNTMFANAMAFNRPDTVYHKQARSRAPPVPKRPHPGAQTAPHAGGTTSFEVVALNCPGALYYCSPSSTAASPACGVRARALGEITLTLMSQQELAPEMWLACGAQAKTLASMTRKLVELGRAGVTDFRGRTAGIARSHNAALAAEQRAAVDRRRAAARCGPNRGIKRSMCNVL